MIEPAAPGAGDVICFSLEPWDDVWRRNQLFATELLELRPSLRILFAEAPVDIGWSLRNRRLPARRPLRPLGTTGRLWAMSPYKLAPRRLWPRTDEGLVRQVFRAATRLGFRQPVLWINDVTYSPLAAAGWPVVYDITDDWLVSALDERERARLARHERELLNRAGEVVVCSPALYETRGRDRALHLITNGVSVEHFRRNQPRPTDLPDGSALVYVGTLAPGRLDLDLCLSLCRHVAGRASVVFVGPNCLSPEWDAQLRRAGALLLGPRPYEQVPGYLQHAEVLIVPHAVSPFTESLDPIKAREFLAVGRPVVTTPVAGFRDVGRPFVVAAAPTFLAAVDRLLAGPAQPPGPGPVTQELPTWRSQAERFLAVLDRAALKHAPVHSSGTPVTAAPAAGRAHAR